MFSLEKGIFEPRDLKKGLKTKRKKCWMSLLERALHWKKKPDLDPDPVTSCGMMSGCEPVQATVFLLHFYIFRIIYCDSTLVEPQFYKEERPLLHVAKNSANKDLALVRDSNSGLPHQCQGPPSLSLTLLSERKWLARAWVVCVCEYGAGLNMTWSSSTPSLYSRIWRGCCRQCCGTGTKTGTAGIVTFCHGGTGNVI